jgi:hypothetical protein
MIRSIALGTALFLSAAACRAGDEPTVLLRGAPDRLGAPTGVLSADLRQGLIDLSGPSAQENGSGSVTGEKSPLLAGAMSAVLPGAGEFYSGSYLKSAAFLVVEAGLWIAAYTYDKKGDRQTDFFQGFANEHWSPYRYAQFSLSKFGGVIGQYDVLINENLPPGQQVNWAELNRMEREIASTDAGRYYSHVLPAYGEQQYFELIGKYPQFNQGWDDAAADFEYGNALTSRFLYYAAERGKANDYYNAATTMTTIVVVNHVLSIIDAALTASAYNRGLHVEGTSMRMPVPGGATTLPAVALAYRW